MKSLVELIQSQGAPPDGQRVYEVTKGDDKEYVISNSPGNAALEVCQVRTVTTKELYLAAAEALKQKESK